eukprot:TRINITY_DN47890_c0_g1_i1.p1 TRINITY_DN47890_c0_g1~~TRINITY_DN47890_c0_g1_i1.p1  ORF type:complete len:118 (-),score=20.24 TRINITY_DN47890_c0_g1_i1:267-620(-)
MNELGGAIVRGEFFVPIYISIAAVSVRTRILQVEPSLRPVVMDILADRWVRCLHAFLRSAVPAQRWASTALGAATTVKNALAGEADALQRRSCCDIAEEWQRWVASDSHVISDAMGE